MYFEFFLRLIPAIFTALLISLTSMPVIIKIAALKKLMDEPDQVRKFHKEIIPTLGGIGIFAGFIISFSIWGDAAKLESYPYFTASLFMLFLIGIKDDILVLSPLKKLVVQVFASAEIVIGGGVILRDFGGIFGIHEISWVAGAIATTFIFIVLINSYNLIDGIDGLAGGVGIVISGILGIWFWGAGFFTLAILSFVLVGALVGFLVYNLHPAKIFMGDTGAMAVGFILAYLIIHFISLNDTIAGSSDWYIEGAPVFAIALLVIPVVDTIRVFVLRILSGNNPLHADDNHTHHQLLKVGMPPHIASFFLWMSNFGVVAVIYYLQFIEINFLLATTLLCGFAVLPICKMSFSYLSSLVRNMDEDIYFLSRGSKKKAVHFLLNKNLENISFSDRNRSGADEKREISI